MTDWTKHDGGPQPVADDVWVEVWILYEGPDRGVSMAAGFDWPYVRRYRILNQHLIDAARIEGIRLGLEAAAEKSTEWQIRPSTRFVDDAIRTLDPETIARHNAVTAGLIPETPQFDVEPAR